MPWRIRRSIASIFCCGVIASPGAHRALGLGGGDQRRFGDELAPDHGQRGHIDQAHREIRIGRDEADVALAAFDQLDAHLLVVVEPQPGHLAAADKTFADRKVRVRTRFGNEDQARGLGFLQHLLHGCQQLRRLGRAVGRRLFRREQCGVARTHQRRRRLGVPPADRVVDREQREVVERGVLDGHFLAHVLVDVGADTASEKHQRELIADGRQHGVARLRIVGRQRAQ